MSKLEELAKRAAAIAKDAVVVTPVITGRAPRYRGLSEEDCAVFDRSFGLPVGWGWSKLQQIRQQNRITEEEYEQQLGNILQQAGGEVRYSLSTDESVDSSV
jgi:O-phosphoseryl-tRNA(Cys) synthetase